MRRIRRHPLALSVSLAALALACVCLRPWPVDAAPPAPPPSAGPAGQTNPGTPRSDAPLRTVTADTDPSRLESINVAPGANPNFLHCVLPPDFDNGRCLRAVRGPFVVTDFTAYALETGTGTIRLFVAPDDAPIDAKGFTPRWIIVPGAPFHGARYQVRAGETLYVSGRLPADMFYFAINVTGFRPY